MNIHQAQLDVIEAALMFTGDPLEALKVIEDIKAQIAAPDLLKAAKDKYDTDYVSVYNDAGTSETDDGCWVEAWVYVNRELCDCQDDGMPPDPETGVIDCSKCGGSGVGTGWYT